MRSRAETPATSVQKSDHRRSRFRRRRCKSHAPRNRFRAESWCRLSIVTSTKIVSGRGHHRRAHAECRSRNHARRKAVVGRQRQITGIPMKERRFDLFLVGRQCDPALQAVQLVASDAALRRRPLRMHDAASGGHPVHFARPDGGKGAEAVPMLDFAIEQIGDGRKTDMRMRPHIDDRCRREIPPAPCDRERRKDRPCGAAPTATLCGSQNRRDRSCAARSRVQWRHSAKLVASGRVLSWKKAHRRL